MKDAWKRKGSLAGWEGPTLALSYDAILRILDAAALRSRLSLPFTVVLSLSSPLPVLTYKLSLRLPLDMAQSPFVLERAETLWRVTKLTENLVDPKVDPRVELHQFFPDVAFVYTFANVTVVNTDEGLVLIDCCHEYFARPLRRCACSSTTRGDAEDVGRRRAGAATRRTWE